MSLRILLLLLFPLPVFSQADAGNPEYQRLVEIAFQNLQDGNCNACLKYYEQAFAISKHSALSHLRAATCAAHCNDFGKRDTLIRSAASIAWDICLRVLDDPESYPEFKPFQGSLFEKTARLAARQQAEITGINLDLANELKQIRHDDQKYRMAMDSIQSVHPNNSPEYQAFIAEWVRTDSLNMARIEAIIAQHGFPGKSLVGEQGASTVWLVIQHAPLEKQEKYFPMLTEAMEKGELKKSDWAYLLDRINMRKGLPQVYGSQMATDPETGQWVLYKLENEAEVNRLRAEAGLPPLEEYTRQFGIEWKPPGKN